MNEVVGVRLATPADWWDLPLDPETRDDKIGHMVEQWAAASGVVADHRDALAATLRTMAASAAKAGAVFASSLSTGRPGRRLAANVIVALVDTGPRPLEQAVRDLVGVAGMDQAGPVAIDQVFLADAGLALRRRSRQALRPPGATRAVEGLVVQFFVPVPGSRVTAVVTFSAPIGRPEDADYAERLFDEMAQGFAFVDAEGKVVADAPPEDPG